jgi:hypothetical protein
LIRAEEYGEQSDPQGIFEASYVDPDSSPNFNPRSVGIGKLNSAMVSALKSPNQFLSRRENVEGA